MDLDLIKMNNRLGLLRRCATIDVVYLARSD
jgi:hypothetical protein